MSFSMKLPVLAVLIALFIAGCTTAPVSGNATNQTVPAAKVNITCADNTFNVSNGSVNRFNTSAMTCRDDCSRISAGAICDPLTCLCKSETRNCTNNTLVAAVVGNNTFNPATMFCRDDCSGLGADYFCDGKCVCRKNVSKKEDVYCVNNSIETAVSGVNTFNSSTMICKDDCLRAGANLKCNANCTCEAVAPPPKDKVDCAANTIVSLIGFSMFRPGMLCTDNCAASLGADYKCDAASCTCAKAKKPGPVYCADNTWSNFFGFTPNTFDPAKMKCEDNCGDLSPDYVCDPKTCTCEAPPVSCVSNSLATFFGGKNGFDPAAMRCQDDCKDAGDEFYCDALECVCKEEPEKQGVSCVYNTDVDFEKALNPSSKDYGTKPIEKFDPATMYCQDDCIAVGDNLQCDPVSCSCVAKKDVTYCSQNTLAVNYPEGQFPPTNFCRDDCKSLNPNYVCDPQGCFCKETRTVTPRCGDGYVSGPGVAGGGMEECDVGFGTYQPKDANGNPINTPDTCLAPLRCEPSTCKCAQPVTEAFCGDGVVSPPLEACDVGSASTNKCSEGFYCNQCNCVKLETSPRCGDGKISVESGEQCDGGSVTTNICQQGYKCYTPECICMPLEGSSQCGDGTVVAPEECDHGNTFTAQCPSGKSCSSCECVDYSELSHTECDYAHGQCVTVQGQGQNECTSDSQCEQVEESVCGNGDREGSEQCDGNDDIYCDSGQSCNQDCQCQTTTTITYHFECQQNACVQVQGAGSSVCNSDDDCVPPVVNCPAYCEGQGYSQSLGSSYSSAGQCQSAAAESASQCTTKCVYSKFYSTSNAAGTTTCCCKQVEVFQCSDCPGENPQCPDPEVVCPANQP